MEAEFGPLIVRINPLVIFSPVLDLDPDPIAHCSFPRKISATLFER